MPIRFRCSYCQKLLGIARRKAGIQTTCPHCGATITVPAPTDGAEDTDLDEIGSLLDASPRPAAPVPTEPTPPAPATPAERPLFERDLDVVLGTTHTAPPRSSPGNSKPAPTSGLDARSLATTPGQVVMSSNKVTVMVVAVVMLLAVAFVAGFLIASR